MELKSLWLCLGIRTIFCDLHRQPIIKLSFWMAPLRPRVHNRESDLCSASIHDTLLTLHTLHSTQHLSPFSKSHVTQCLFVFVFASGSQKDTWRRVAGCQIYKSAFFRHNPISGVYPRSSHDLWNCKQRAVILTKQLNKEQKYLFTLVQL